MQQLSDHWPSGTPWPSDIPRPAAPAGDLCRGGGARAAIGDLCRIISELDRRHRGTSPADPVSAPPAPGRRVEGTVAGPMAVTHAALPLGRC